MDVDAESARALVPSLITQPLTENVIRHAVATSRAQIRLTIRARRFADQLHISIVNSLSGQEPAAGAWVQLVGEDPGHVRRRRVEDVPVGRGQVTAHLDAGQGLQGPAVGLQVGDQCSDDRGRPAAGDRPATGGVVLRR